MLDAPREGHDDGVELEDSVGGPIPKMEGPLEYVVEHEMLAKQVPRWELLAKPMSSNKH